jgi:hypothetical protein
MKRQRQSLVLIERDEKRATQIRESQEGNGGTGRGKT